MRQGGGMGDLFAPNGDAGSNFGTSMYKARAAFDFLFYVFLIIIILNLVLGIIVDVSAIDFNSFCILKLTLFKTFTQLRDEREKIIEDIQTKCFICSLEAHDFLLVGGFQRHQSEDHDVWLV